MKPRMFIGSSAEGINIAHLVQENLKRGSVEVTVWDQDVFRLSKSTFASLLDSASVFDFGLFIFSADDITKIRRTKHRTVRDNVLFEFGLFLGRLGRDRCFFLVPRNAPDFHLPTDLLSITPATYDAVRDDQNLKAALAPACKQILREILNASSGTGRNQFLGGEWIHKWSVNSKFHPKENEGTAIVKHINNSFVATFASAEETPREKIYQLTGLVGPGPYITGTWQDTKEEGGYFGVFQFCISPSKTCLVGKWVGFGIDTGIMCNDWEWHRPQASPLSAGKRTRKR